MALTAEMVVQEALDLPVQGRAFVVEKLLASLAGETNTETDRAHLDEIRARRANAGARFTEGKTGLQTVRAALGK